jgi:fructose/tagatose bisphosphate aldolase
MPKNGLLAGNYEENMADRVFTSLVTLFDGAVEVVASGVKVQDENAVRRRIGVLIERSVFGKGDEQAQARFLTRLISLELNVVPASIHDLYMARGRGDVPANFTVPAMNLRALSFDAAKAVFRAAEKIEAGAMLFEIARSEMGYTNQSPAEYATNILGAAISEGYSGPVFIQGDHFQISPSRYADDPDKELEAVRALIGEAIEAGFYNIDIDTSTLVDLSKKSVAEQQRLNAELSVMFTEHIRELEPEGVAVSVGGEIGEVGGQNSTEEELRAYVDGYRSNAKNEMIGLSKISVQTGTSHGGVVLPDGSVADVNVDFDAMLRLSQVAREEYGYAGAVQHGASTLPEEAFSKFIDAQACEVHLATNFQNMLYDRIPQDLQDTIHAYLDANHANERKEGQTNEQFYYKTRKRAIGPFKSELWGLKAEVKTQIRDAWEAQFDQLFASLGISGTKKIVTEFVNPIKIAPHLSDYYDDPKELEDVSDLAD